MKSFFVRIVACILAVATISADPVWASGVSCIFTPPTHQVSTINIQPANLYQSQALSARMIGAFKGNVRALFVLHGAAVLALAQTTQAPAGKAGLLTQLLHLSPLWAWTVSGLAVLLPLGFSNMYRTRIARIAAAAATASLLWLFLPVASAPYAVAAGLALPFTVPLLRRIFSSDLQAFRWLAWIGIPALVVYAAYMAGHLAAPTVIPAAKKTAREIASDIQATARPGTSEGLTTFEGEVHYVVPDGFIGSVKNENIKLPKLITPGDPTIGVEPLDDSFAQKLAEANATLSRLKLGISPMTLDSLKTIEKPPYIVLESDAAEGSWDSQIQEYLTEITNLERRYNDLTADIQNQQSNSGVTLNVKDDPRYLVLQIDAERFAAKIRILDRKRMLWNVNARFPAQPLEDDKIGTRPLKSGESVLLFKMIQPDFDWVPVEMDPAQAWLLNQKWDSQADLILLSGKTEIPIPMSKVLDMQNGAANTFAGAESIDLGFGVNNTATFRLLVPDHIQAKLSASKLSFKEIRENGVAVPAVLTQAAGEVLVLATLKGTDEKISHPKIAKAIEPELATYQSMIRRVDQAIDRLKQIQHETHGNAGDGGALDALTNLKRQLQDDLKKLSEEAAHWRKGITPPEDPTRLVQYEGSSLLVPKNINGYLSDSLNNNFEAPADAEEFVRLGPGPVTVRISGNTFTQFAPEKGEKITATFPTGKTHEMISLGTEPIPGSAEVSARSYRAMTAIDSPDLTNYIPGGKRKRPPSYFLLLLKLRDHTLNLEKSAPQAAPQPPKPPLKKQIPSRKAVIPGKKIVMKLLRTLALLGLFTTTGQTILGQSPTVQTQTTQNKAAEIAATNHILGQGDDSSWNVKTFPASAYSMMSAGDIVDMVIANNPEIKEGFFRHRQKLALALESGTPNPSVSIGVDPTSRAPGLTVGEPDANGNPQAPRLELNTTVVTRLDDQQPQSRLLTVPNGGPLGGLAKILGGFQIISPVTLDKVTQQREMNAVQAQLEELNMQALAQQKIQQAFELWFQLAIIDAHIERLDFQKRADLAIVAFFDSHKEVLQQMHDFARLNQIRIEIPAMQEERDGLWNKRADVEDQLLFLLGSPQISTQTNLGVNKLQDRPHIRPVVPDFVVTRDVLDKLGVPGIPDEGQFHASFQQALLARLEHPDVNASQEEKNRARALKDIFDPATDNFIFEVMLGENRSAAQKNPLSLPEPPPITVDYLVAPLPNTLAPWMVPGTEVEKAELDYLRFQGKLVADEGKMEYRIGASIRGKIDSNIPYPAALLDWGMRFPENAQLIALKEDELKAYANVRRAEREQYERGVTKQFNDVDTARQSAQRTAVSHGTSALTYAKWVNDKFPITRNESTDRRVAWMLDWRDARLEALKVKEDQLNIWRAKTSVLQMTEPSIRYNRNHLITHYALAIQNAKEKGLLTAEPPQAPKPHHWRIPHPKLPFIKSKGSAAIESSGGMEPRHPALGHGYLDEDPAIDSYIIRRRQFRMVRSSWLDPETGIHEDELAKGAAQKLFLPGKLPGKNEALIREVPRLDAIAFLMGIKDRSMDPETLQRQIYEKLESLRTHTPFFFNRREGTGYHLPLFRKNPVTGRYDYVAMHFGRYGVWVLSADLWKKLLERGNEEALIAALAWELMKKENLDAVNDKNLAYKVESGDGLKDIVLENGQRIPMQLEGDDSNALNYEKRVIRLRRLIDPTDKLGALLRDLEADDIAKGDINPYLVRSLPKEDENYTDLAIATLDVMFENTALADGEMMVKPGDPPGYRTVWQKMSYFIKRTILRQDDVRQPLHLSRILFKMYSNPNASAPKPRMTSSMASRNYRRYVTTLGIRRSESRARLTAFGLVNAAAFGIALVIFPELRQWAWRTISERSEIADLWNVFTGAKRIFFISYVVGVPAIALLELAGRGISMIPLILWGWIISPLTRSAENTLRSMIKKQPAAILHRYDQTPEHPEIEIIESLSPKKLILEDAMKEIGLFFNRRLLSILSSDPSNPMFPFTRYVMGLWQLYPVLRPSPDITVPGHESLDVPKEENTRDILALEGYTEDEIKQAGTVEWAQATETILRNMDKPLPAVLALAMSDALAPAMPHDKTKRITTERVYRKWMERARLMYPDIAHEYQRAVLISQNFELYHLLVDAIRYDRWSPADIQVLGAVVDAGDPLETATWQKSFSRNHLAFARNLTANDFDIINLWVNRLFLTNPTAAIALHGKFKGQVHHHSEASAYDEPLLSGARQTATIRVAQLRHAHVEALTLLNTIQHLEGSRTAFGRRPVYIPAGLFVNQPEALRMITLIKQLTKQRPIIYNADPTLQPFMHYLKSNCPSGVEILDLAETQARLGIRPSAALAEGHGRFVRIHQAMRAIPYYVRRTIDRVRTMIYGNQIPLVFLPTDARTRKALGGARATLVGVPHPMLLPSAMLYTLNHVNTGDALHMTAQTAQQISKHEDLLESFPIRLATIDLRQDLPTHHDLVFIYPQAGNEQGRTWSLVPERKETVSPYDLWRRKRESVHSFSQRREAHAA